MSRIYLGRHVYGFAAVMFGIITIAWRDFNAWREIVPLGRVGHPEIFLYIAAAIELLGGVAIQFRLTRRIGAFALGGIYLIFALLWVPYIVAKPLSYGGWGNFFEWFSVVGAAMVVYGATGSNNHEGAPRLARLGYVFFGICVFSFAIEQLAYFSMTVQLVPKWIPPGQLFWAIGTTIAFALAGVAILSGHSALLASRLLTIMLIAFGILIWIRIVVLDPHTLFNWTENAENLAIAGAAWIVSDYLSQSGAAGVQEAAGKISIDRAR